MADEHPTLFDLGASKAARDEGMAAAERGARDDWLEQARTTIEQVAHRQAELTSDDLWAFGLPKPREPRALGPVMKWAQKQGLIVPTSTVRLTAQVSGHAHPVRVWRSCCYGASDG